MTDIDWSEARRTPILEVLDALGVEPPNSDGKTFCVFHDEATPSMHIYVSQNRWYSYCCGRGGDVIALACEVTGRSSGRAAAWLLSSGFEPIDPVERKVRREGQIDLAPRVYREAIPCARGTTSPMDVRVVAEIDRLVRVSWPALHPVWRSIVYHFNLYRSSTVGLWVPHWQWNDEGDLVTFGVKTRPASGDLSRKFSLKGSTFQHLYRPIDLKRDGWVPSTLLLCEGESDTWCMFSTRFDHAGLDVGYAGLPAGAGTITPEIVADINRHDRVLLFFDADDAGRKAARTIQERADAEVVDMIDTIPGGRVAEAVSAGWVAEVPS